jgi:hypothetical protein
MNLSYEYCLEVYRNTLLNNVFSWSIMVAKAVAFIIVVVHYFKIYYKAFSERQGYKIKTYEILRPFIYLLIIVFYTTFLNVLDDTAGAVEDSFFQYKTEGRLIELNEAGLETVSPNAPPPATAEERTAKSTAGILDYLENPNLILFKLLDVIIELINGLLFVFAVILRFAFLFVLRFLAPFAIVASIFEHYNKFFWNWLKVYLIVFASIFVFFVINIFCNSFYNEVVNAKLTGIAENGKFTSDNFVSSLILLCIVLVKTTLYGRSTKFMYQIFRNS